MGHVRPRQTPQQRSRLPAPLPERLFLQHRFPPARYRPRSQITTREVRMKKYVAEFFGTFSLVFAGTGAIIINDVGGGPVTHGGIALTFGLVVLAMIYAVGDVSGAHLNPAVTLGFFAARRMDIRESIPYIISQCAGALAASGVLRGLFPQHATLGATEPAGSDLQSFVLEAILT